MKLPVTLSKIFLTLAVAIGFSTITEFANGGETRTLSNQEMSLIVGNVPGDVSSCALIENATDLSCPNSGGSGSNCSSFNNNQSSCERGGYWPNPDDYCHPDEALPECVGGGSDQNKSCSCSEGSLSNPCGRLDRNACSYNSNTGNCTNDCTTVVGNVCGGWGCTLQ